MQTQKFTKQRLFSRSACCQCQRYNRIKFEWQREPLDRSRMAVHGHGQGFRFERSEIIGQCK